MKFGKARKAEDETGGRDMTREAFRKAMASGRSPGAASLLAEVERGWARADGRSEDPGAAGVQEERERMAAEIAERQPCTTAPDGTGARCTCAYDCRNYWMRARGMNL